MAKWTANSSQAGSLQVLTTTYKTQVGLTAATATLTTAKITDLYMGPAAVPNSTDCEIVWQVDAQTTVGTGTTITPQLAGDTGRRASGTVGTANHTVEPTVTAATAVFTYGMNQRNSLRYAVVPGFEIIIPATNLAGFGLRAKSSTNVGTVTGGMNFEE